MQWILYLGIGALSGLTSGLLREDGRLLVPALMFALPFAGVNGSEVIKIAIATTLTINIFTSVSTARAYVDRGSVHWRALYLIAPGTVLGVIGGVLLAAHTDVTTVTLLFAAATIYMAWQMTHRPARHIHTEPLPGLLNLSGKGLAVGGLVGAVGCSGLSVPILAHYMTVRHAIGTAAVLRILVSALAVSTYAATGAPDGCQNGCLGYVHLPAVCAAGIAAVLFAPLGSVLAHSLPVPALKRIFAAALVLVAFDLARKTLPPGETFAREAKATLVALEGNNCHDD
jgi:uncharacterized membrane protein YfcA